MKNPWTWCQAPEGDRMILKPRLTGGATGEWGWPFYAAAPKDETAREWVVSGREFYAPELPDPERGMALYDPLPPGEWEVTSCFTAGEE